MKRHNKARKATELLAVIILASAILGACAENVQKQKIPAATYMGGKASITGICKELDAAGASHVDLFQEWVVDFADSAGKNAMRGQNSPQNTVNLQKKLQFFLEKGRFPIDSLVIIGI